VRSERARPRLILRVFSLKIFLLLSVSLSVYGRLAFYSVLRDFAFRVSGISEHCSGWVQGAGLVPLQRMATAVLVARTEHLRIDFGGRARTRGLVGSGSRRTATENNNRETRRFRSTPFDQKLMLWLSIGRGETHHALTVNIVRSPS
jgi:hypothetical protein